MANILKGSVVAQALRDKLLLAIAENELKPVLAIVRVGAQESDLAYERGIQKTCDLLGIEKRLFELPYEVSQEELEATILRINQDSEIHGMLLFRPLPKELDEARLLKLIDPDKDMDCMTPSNWAKLVMGDEDCYAPCTAEAVMHMLDGMHKNCDGAKAVVIGRSQVIGKPVSLMLLSRNATLTCCHSHTKNLAAACKDADILVAACGFPNLIGREIAEVLPSHCVVVDVGVNYVDGKMQGDVSFDQVEPLVDWITPVPGGVGAVTNTVLASHVVRAALKAKGIPFTKFTFS